MEVSNRRLFGIILIGVYFVVGASLVQWMLKSDMLSLILGQSAFLISTVIAVFLMRLKSVSGIIKLGLADKQQWFLLPVILVLSFCSMIGLSGLMEWMFSLSTWGQEALLNDMESIDRLSSLFSDRSPYGALLAFLGLGLLPGFCEEFFFRGGVLRLFPIETRLTYSILGSAVVFSLLHFQLTNILSIFFMGFVLAYTYWSTKSIWYSISIHCLFNFTSWLMMDWLNGVEIEIPAVAFLIAVPGLLFILKKYFSFSI